MSEFGMERGLKVKWLEGLRGEKYRQGTGYLKTKKDFCCLGVLCDVAGLGWDGVDGALVYNVKDTTAAKKLTTRLKSQLGLSSADVEVLMSMNDGDGVFTTNSRSFAEIADWIELNVAEASPDEEVPPDEILTQVKEGESK